MKKIFIADDRKTNYIALRTAIDEIMPGCEISYASNGREVVNLVEKEKPDLILMDVLMPLMDGIEATAEIRKKYSAKELPIIAMTAQDKAAASKVVLEAGCNEYLIKPYSLSELTEKVSAYLLTDKKS